MFSRIEQEKIIIESEDKFPIDSRIVFLFLYFVGFGAPFFYLGDKNKGFIAIAVTLMIILSFFINELKTTLIFFLLSSIVYTITYIDSFIMISKLNKEQKIKKTIFVENKMKEIKGSDQYEEDIDLDIYIYSKKNKELKKRHGGLFCSLGYFFGFYNFYIKEYNNGFSILKFSQGYQIALFLFFIVVIISKILALLMCILILIAISLFTYYYINTLFKMNNIIEYSNYQLRKNKMSFLNELEEKYLLKTKEGVL